MKRRAYLGLLAAGAGAKVVSRVASSDLESESDSKVESNYEIPQSPPVVINSSGTYPDRTNGVQVGSPDSYWITYNSPIPRTTGPNTLLESKLPDDMHIRYSWEYEGERSATLEYDENLYRYYTLRPRTRNYGHYASHPYQDEFLNRVLDAVAIDSNDDGYREVASIQQFVQGLKYTTDEVSTGWNEYPKYPLETLLERGGDCEDSALLMATLLWRLGYATVLLAFWDDNHMALGVAGTTEGFFNGGTYYTYAGRKFHYVEPTNTGWNIGEQPMSITTHPEIIPINGYPVISGVWTADWNEDTNQFDVSMTLRNIGDAVASNIYTTVRLSSGQKSSPSKETFVRFISEDEFVETGVSFSADELPSVASGEQPQLHIEFEERGQLHDSRLFELTASS